NERLAALEGTLRRLVPELAAGEVHVRDGVVEVLRVARSQEPFRLARRLAGVLQDLVERKPLRDHSPAQAAGGSLRDAQLDAAAERPLCPHLREERADLAVLPGSQGEEEGPPEA